jgi:nucleoside phosphorylase
VIARLREIAQDQPWQLAIGPILTSDRVLASAAEKRVAGATGALAVEMEAGPLARWARDRDVHFAHLRVVLDPLDATVWRLLSQARTAHRALAWAVAALACPDGPLEVRA